MILVVAIIVALLVLNGSGKKNEEKFWTERNSRPVTERPEHEMVDNQPSSSAWVVVVLIAAICVFIAMH